MKTETKLKCASLLAAVLAAGCVDRDIVREEGPNAAVVHLTPLKGSTVRGTGVFAQEQGVTRLELKLTGLRAGEHAVHLHESCDGPHWNPTGNAHGQFANPPFHLGDIGNVTADDRGVATLVFSTGMWSVGTKLLGDVVGTALVVHAGTDDFTSQPGGNAGDRIACGVVELEGAPPRVSLR